jgi:hypothetical protein
VSYTVMVPQQRTSTYSVCVSDIVPETKTEKYIVRVPVKTTKTICTKVRKCFEEEIPAAGSYGNGSNGGDAGANGGDGCNDCDSGNAGNGGHGGRGGRGLLGCKKGC